MFAALSEPSILDKYVPLYVAMAPVTKLTNTEFKLITLLTKHYLIVHKIIEKFGINEILSRSYYASLAMNYICEELP